MRTRYKFLGRTDGNSYVWHGNQRLASNDSRIEEIRCDKDWFFNKEKEN